MSDIHIRIEGCAGRITLDRPKALNALTYDMCSRIEDALDTWRDDPVVTRIILDATGDKAFCAGGDIQDLYARGKAGDFAYGQRFWADEYRLNAKIYEYPKPIISFLQGFTMGGGVGLGCHGTHRIVDHDSQIAMPECSIGLVPDVGGSLMLALAPGRLGEYLGLSTARMRGADAIYAGFADLLIPRAQWGDLIAGLCDGAEPGTLSQSAVPDAPTTLPALQATIDRHFGGETLNDILRSLRAVPDGAEDAAFAAGTLKLITRNAPLSMACAVEMLHRLRGPSADIRKALELEYRFTYRALEHSDFIEGIRAQIIDKDRSPRWQHPLDAVPATAVSTMLMPLGAAKLSFEKKDIAMKIGFIGLGNMGGPMAANLVAAGHAVSGFDTADVQIDGVTPAASAAEAATGAAVVITMLPNGRVLRAVAEEVIPAMAPGAVLLDCSTVDVDSARSVAAAAQAAGLSALDAPVSGGIGGAAGGTLTFMVGGDAAGLKIAMPLFEIMGQKAVHCGPSGNGQAAKICNNMILGVTMIATCEAFALADKLGLDRQAMFDVVSTSSGYSWSMNAYCPAPGIGPQSPADNGYMPGFAAELMLKDLGLSQQAAESVDADTPLGHAALDLYRAFVEDEDGKGRDFSAMLPRFEGRGRSGA